MSSLNTRIGREGKFDIGGTAVARLTLWTVNPTLATTSEWGDSDSAGSTNRAAGRKDLTFTTEGKYDSTNEIFDLFQPDDVAEAVLWLGDVALFYWNMPRALCTDFTLAVNPDTQEVIGWTGAFGSDGVFYYPGEPGANVHSYP